jgi:hypothetical protein
MVYGLLLGVSLILEGKEMCDSSVSNHAYVAEKALPEGTLYFAGWARPWRCARLSVL